MKSFLACLLIAACFTAVFAVQCKTTNLKCVGNNAACSQTTTDTTITVLECSNHQTCNATSSGGSAGDYTGTCVTAYSSGHDCRTAADDCDDGLFCVGSGTWGICTTITYNVAAGGTCDDTHECSASTYCNSATSGTCVARATSGQSCATGTQCTFDTVCGASGNCVAHFSVAVGSSCNVYNFLNNECVAGSACIGTTTGTCQSVSASSNKACTGPLDTTTCTATNEACTAGCYGSNVNVTYQCVNPYNALVKSSTDASNYNSFYSCQVKNNNICDSLASCGSCKGAYCKAANPVEPCGGFCSSATGVAVSAIFLVAALFVSM